MNNHTHRVSLIALILAGTFFCSSCSKTPAAKRYPFTGRVTSVDSQAQSAIIDGDAIPGFMDAMAMPYKVKPSATLNHLIPGDSISAEVVVVQPGKNDDTPPDYWLENVKVIAHIDPAHAAGANSLHMPAPGEDVPDFSFTNQSGKNISLKHYRGKVLLVTFIYTRCPFPDFCPRMSSNFAQIYREMGTDPALAGTHLLSVSFDPDHDTPQVLRDYGFSVAHTHESALFSRWEFAAPRASDLPRIADFFALTIKPEGGMITHNLSTAVIGPDGKIVKWYHGSNWQPSDLIKDAAGASAQKS
ncbi:MAG: SCO family protein [Candidatus Sulfotelmatobacter sp.]